MKASLRGPKDWPLAADQFAYDQLRRQHGLVQRDIAMDGSQPIVELVHQPLEDELARELKVKKSTRLIQLNSE